MFRGRTKVGNVDGTMPKGTWVYGSYVHINTPEIKHNLIVVSFTGIDHAVDPKTIGLYIGIEDKTGKEIYKGDIVYLYDGGDCFDGVYLINWSNEMAGWWIFKDDKEDYECECNPWSYLSEQNIEVIGNIYQDSHLLVDKPKD